MIFARITASFSHSLGRLRKSTDVRFVPNCQAQAKPRAKRATLAQALGTKKMRRRESLIRVTAAAGGSALPRGCRTTRRRRGFLTSHRLESMKRKRPLQLEGPFSFHWRGRRDSNPRPSGSKRVSGLPATSRKPCDSREFTLFFRVWHSSPFPPISRILGDMAGDMKPTPSPQGATCGSTRREGASRAWITGPNLWVRYR